LNNQHGIDTPTRDHSSVPGTTRDDLSPTPDVTPAEDPAQSLPHQSTTSQQTSRVGVDAIALLMWTPSKDTVFLPKGSGVHPCIASMQPVAPRSRRAAITGSLQLYPPLSATHVVEVVIMFCMGALTRLVFRVKP